MGFYDNFLRLCNQRGLPPTTAAERAGIDRSAVSRWKKGKLPYSSTLHKLAEFFDVDANSLLNDIIGEYSNAEDMLLTAQERRLVSAWRLTDTNTRANIAFMLRSTGFTFVEADSDAVKQSMDYFRRYNDELSNSVQGRKLAGIETVDINKPLDDL